MSHRPDVELELGFDPVHSFWDTPHVTGITWGGTDPVAGTGYTGVDTDMYGFDWWQPELFKENLAQTTYDILDPAFGEGGALEPVTVWIDPDRTIKEEYIDPTLDEYGMELGLALVGLVAVASILK